MRRINATHNLRTHAKSYTASLSYCLVRGVSRVFRKWKLRRDAPGRSFGSSATCGVRIDSAAGCVGSVDAGNRVTGIIGVTASDGANGDIRRCCDAIDRNINDGNHIGNADLESRRWISRTMGSIEHLSVR